MGTLEARHKPLEPHNRSITQITDPAMAPAVGALLARALESSFTPNLPDPGERLRFCTLLYTANTRWSLERGSVWCTTAADGSLTGVLSLINKPEPAWIDADDVRYGYDALSEFSDVMSDVGSIEEAAHAPFSIISGSWFYINVLGVEPTWQSQGLGAALMHYMIAGADRESLSIGLITDSARNVHFYQRFGFETVREGNEATQSLWTMIRPLRG